MATELLEKQIFDKDLQNRIKELLDAKKLDMTTIARGVNKSTATISLYLSDKYSGRVDNLEEELKNYLKVFDTAVCTEVKTLSFVETNVSKRLFNAANMCRLKGKMGACYGSPGIGKTTTIKKYQEVSASVIVLDPCEKISSRSILAQIAKQLKFTFSNNSTTDEIINSISKKLFKNKYLIIVDEAENLKLDSFKVLRKLFDRAEGCCGLLFVGTEELYELLLKVRYGLPYISSRIGYIERLDSLKYTDVEKLVYQYFPECESRLVQLIAKNCNYNARAIQNVLDLCSDIVISNNITLNEDVIDAAREKILI